MNLIFLALALTPLQAKPVWTVTTVDGIQSVSVFPTIDWERIVAVQRRERALPPWPVEPHVILANGDRINGRPITADARSLIVQSDDCGKLAIPLTAIAAVWFTTLPVETPLDPMKTEWISDRSTDAVRLTNGDVLRGTLDRIDADLTVWLKTPGNLNRKLDRNQIAAVALAAGLSRVRTPKSVYGQLVTTLGSRISVSKFQNRDQAHFGDAIAGFPIEVAEQHIVAFSVLAGQAVYLSDLKPKRVQVDPYLMVTWPPEINRSAKGNALTIGTSFGPSTYDRGLGMHARTTMEYDLAGRYRRFEAVVGLDTASSQRGRVPVRIRVDGVNRDIDGLNDLTAVAGPIRVSLDLTKAKLLSLMVDFGPHGDGHSDVNWCDARLIK